MKRLIIHSDAADDLESLNQEEALAAGQIIALLEEIEGSSDLLERLTDHGFGSDEAKAFSVSKWFEHWNQGKDLWRLKVWDLEKQGLRYRIIYAYVPKELTYYILAIAPREFNYESENPITKRILEAYSSL